MLAAPLGPLAMRSNARSFRKSELVDEEACWTSPGQASSGRQRFHTAQEAVRRPKEQASHRHTHWTHADPQMSSFLCWSAEATA
jgi:hypothetical protein